MENGEGAPGGATTEATGTDRANPSLPSTSKAGVKVKPADAERSKAAVEYGEAAVPQVAAAKLVRDEHAVPQKYIMDGKPSGPKKPFNVSYPGRKWNKITNAKGGLPVGRAAYNLHIANLKVAKKIRKETDILIPEAEGSMMIGLLTKDGKSIVCGDEQRHGPLLSHVKSLLSHASPKLRDFQFSALAITKGWRRLKSITDAKVTAETMPGHEEPIGERIFFPWSEKASVFTKMDASSKVNIHGKLLR